MGKHTNKNKKNKQKKVAKPEPKGLKLFDSKWEFSIPGKENMERMGMHVVKDKINIRSLLYYPWTDFFVRPTCMMTEYGGTAVVPFKWVHSLHIFDVYLTLEILAIQYTTSAAARWDQYLVKDGVSSDATNPEHILLNKINDLYQDTHKAMLNHRNTAVESYRKMRSFSKMLQPEVAVQFIAGVAADTLADWIKATELFFHTMIALNTIMTQFLDIRRAKYNAHDGNFDQVIFENALKNMEDQLNKPALQLEATSAPWYNNIMYHELASKYMVTSSISIAPQAAVTESMQDELAAKNAQVLKILDLLNKGVDNIEHMQANFGEQSGVDAETGLKVVNELVNVAAAAASEPVEEQKTSEIDDENSEPMKKASSYQHLAVPESMKGIPRPDFIDQLKEAFKMYSMGPGQDDDPDTDDSDTVTDPDDLPPPTLESILEEANEQAVQDEDESLVIVESPPPLTEERV